MNEQNFEALVSATLDQIKETLIIKGKEYRRNGNVFHNFDAGARRQNKLREEVLQGFQLKHDISIEDMISDLHKGKQPSEAAINEKFGDILIYTILLKAMLVDRIGIAQI